ncbi:MAG: hypothetical protein EPO07_07410 [Verrucomicrobia bacterium]|nr:MAG: hypothetical protein EPO07_07410 [Verrucomicrobiota bacterium]
MADPTPTPAPQPDPKTPTSRGDINKADLEQLKADRTIAQAAQNPNHVPKLNEKEIVQADVTQLLADITDAENVKAPAVLTATSAKETTTAHEETARKALMPALREIQDAVKRKYEVADPSKLAAYFIAKKKFGDDRPGLEADSQSMLDQAATDALPGINAARITAITGLRSAWMKADDEQNAAIIALEKTRAAFKTALDSIRQRARGIQLAANSGWSHTDPANAAIRRAFNLPANRPLN